LLQRSTTAAALVFCAATHLRESSQPSLVIPDLVAAGAGILLLIGLWTPIVGTTIAVLEAWIAFLHAGDALVPTLLAMLGVTLAIIGPGAWSVDARLFGRKHFTIHDR
jgi:putative oxidoreductase